MTVDRLLERLKKFYSSTFDLEENHIVEQDGHRFALYGHFNVDNSRYVLSKKAKLWEANCQEHLFVDVPAPSQNLQARQGNSPEGKLDAGCQQSIQQRLEAIDDLIKERIEPEYIRGGEKYPPANHMYSYITVVLVTDEPLSKDDARRAKNYSFGKTYKFNLRGYMETRLVLVSTADKSVVTNRAGKELAGAYQGLMRT